MPDFPTTTALPNLRCAVVTVTPISALKPIKLIACGLWLATWDAFGPRSECASYVGMVERIQVKLDDYLPLSQARGIYLNFEWALKRPPLW